MLEGRDFEQADDGAKVREALALVKQALAELLTVESNLMRAAGKLFGTPSDDRLTSLAMSVEDVECDVRKEIRRLERM